MYHYDKSSKLVSSVPVRWTLVEVCVCRFVHFHTYRPAKEWQQMRLNRKERAEHKIVDRWAELYCKGGELGSTAASPCDEDDKSAGLSAGGGVLGTRSGLSGCTPENKEEIKTTLLSGVDSTETMNPRSVGVASLLTALCLRLGAFEVAVVEEFGVGAWLACGVRQRGGTTQSGGPAETPLTSASTLLRGRGFHWKCRTRT